jgi:hypothetical protein
MNLLYLTFGENISNHTQAQFSICSFLAQRQFIKSINVVTDQPDFYNNLQAHLNVIKVDTSTLNQWKGEYNFFWRIKIKAIGMLCDMYKSEPVVYLDSDTFLYNDVTTFQQQLIHGKAFMHEIEGKLSKLKSKTEKKMWREVGRKVLGAVEIKEHHAMWNAGVVATPNSKGGKDITAALAICDDMCKQKVTPRLIEQFALSVALHEHYGLLQADKYIGHYWANKESWNKSINEVLTEAYCKSLTTEQTIDRIAAFDYYELPVKRRVKNTKLRLEKAINNIFPDKDVAFIDKPFDTRR